MPRFFVSPADVRWDGETGTAVLRGEDVAHIKRVLRMGPGDGLTLCDGNGTEFESVIVSSEDVITARILSSAGTRSEPPYLAAVYQALVKGDRFDTVVMKSTELGASRIIPVMTARCMVRLDEKDYPKKLARWQKIAAEAAGQCGRGRIPEVCRPMSFDDAVREAASADLPLFCYEGGEGTETVPLPELMQKKDSIRTASVVIGPEGGFEPEEAAAAVKNGLWPAGLGYRILRTETAAPFVLSALSCRYELTGIRT
ncbi:MAG: 16S rRNA (uracil(1498)-N(3))-methyltransferase [Clostridiales bacterium]|nr:16S rRNA (uracil(1498)-N(3))-methyltransferase [Clostridiales bacterium]